ncbi:hypothetical protein CDAR_585241, partial [Caerostris darwini]
MDGWPNDVIGVQSRGVNTAAQGCPFEVHLFCRLQRGDSRVSQRVKSKEKK